MHPRNQNKYKPYYGVSVEKPVHYDGSSGFLMRDSGEPPGPKDSALTDAIIKAHDNRDQEEPPIDVPVHYERSRERDTDTRMATVPTYPYLYPIGIGTWLGGLGAAGAALAAGADPRLAANAAVVGGLGGAIGGGIYGHGSVKGSLKEIARATQFNENEEKETMYYGEKSDSTLVDAILTYGDSEEEPTNYQSGAVDVIEEWIRHNPEWAMAIAGGGVGSGVGAAAAGKGKRGRGALIGGGLGAVGGAYLGANTSAALKASHGIDRVQQWISPEKRKGAGYLG